MCFPTAGLPGRGKAEYGGLSLQSARLGYSTVISLCLLQTPRKPHITKRKCSPLRFILNRVDVHSVQIRKKRGRINAEMFSLLLSPQLSSCIFIPEAIHSSAARGDVGLPSNRGRVTSNKRHTSPTCGMEMLNESFLHFVHLSLFFFFFLFADPTR